MSENPSDVSLVIEFDHNCYSLPVPAALMTVAQDFFARMDLDMDAGWQMSRWWVPDPDQLQRCQIVADKLLNAMIKKDEQSACMMGAYILRQKPETRHIRINTEGQIQGTEFFDTVPDLK